VTLVSYPPFCAEHMVAQLSSLFNEHIQEKEDRPVELIQVVLKNIEKQEAKIGEEEVARKSRNIQVTILQWQ